MSQQDTLAGNSTALKWTLRDKEQFSTALDAAAAFYRGIEHRAEGIYVNLADVYSEQFRAYNLGWSTMINT